MNRRWKQGFTIAITVAAALGATAAMADFKGSDEELARELDSHLDELVVIADGFVGYDGVDGESFGVEEASALVDWLGSAAREIEQRFEQRGDSSGRRHAKALGEAAQNALRELGEYAKDKSSPKLCDKALRKVLEAVGVVLKSLGSER